MKPRNRQPIGIQATYTLDEMIDSGVISLSRDSLKRLLLKNGVEFLHNGRAILVPLSELQKKTPLFFDAFVAALRLRAEVE